MPPSQGEPQMVKIAAAREPNGESFAAEVLHAAREGVIAQVRYLYPQPD